MLVIIKKTIEKRKCKRIVALLTSVVMVDTIEDILSDIKNKIEHLENIDKKVIRKTSTYYKVITLVHRILMCFYTELDNLKIRKNDFFNNMINMTMYEDDLAVITSYDYTINKITKNIHSRFK